MMRLGGCGAETACDSSLYFALHRGVEGIYPFDPQRLSKREYVDFAHMMEKYLWPRMSGIDRVEIFINGYGKYLRDRGIHSIAMEALEGTAPYGEASAALIKQIDAGYPVPTLILNHRDRGLSDYNWHWFLINGYDQREDTLLVKTVTYSSYEWVDFRRLWDTGYSRRGGLVLFDNKDL